MLNLCWCNLFVIKTHFYAVHMKVAASICQSYVFCNFIALETGENRQTFFYYFHLFLHNGTLSV